MRKQLFLSLTLLMMFSAPLTAAPTAVPKVLKAPTTPKLKAGDPTSTATATPTATATGTATATATSSVTPSATPCAKDPAVIFTGDVKIASSSDTAQLAGKCVIEGNLTVKSDLSTLDGLISLRHVTGNLDISGNPDLISLAGLQNLQTIGGWLWISGNAQLSQIKGLNALVKTGGLIIEGNATLTAISGFKALKKVTGNLVAINDNDRLTTVTGFGALVRIEKDLNVYGNAVLTGLNTMNRLASVGGNFKIWENAALAAIDGFKNLKSTGSSQSDGFTISKNTALLSLSGLAALTTLKNLTIQYNTSLPQNLAECLGDQATVAFYKLISYNGTANAETCPTASISTATATDSDTTTGTATDSDVAGTGTATGTSTATAPTTGSEVLSFDFSSGLPSGVAGNCVVSDGAVHLPQNTDGTFVEECHIDIAVTASQISDKTVALDATRVNSLVSGDFEGMGETDIRLYAPTNTAYKTDKATGAWYSSVTNAANRPAAVEDTGGNATVTLSKTKTGLTQFVKVKPGIDLRLAFDADTSLLGTASGTDQLFYLSMAFYDAGFKALTFLNPIKEETSALQANFINYGPDEGAFHEEMLLRVIDCDEHVKYQAGGGVYASTLSFNQCQDTNGKALTNESGEEYTKDDIAHMGIVLSVNWSTADGSTTLDNVVLDYVQQIELQILDKAGTVTRKAAGGNSMYAETVSEDGTLRIYLRTLKPSESPLIRNITIPGAAGVTVTAGAAISSYTSSRLGGLCVYGPKVDFENPDIALRSLCTDPLTHESISCLDLGARYDNNIFRWPFFQAKFTVKKSADGTDWEFSLNESGELNLKRLLEFTDLGQQVNVTLVKSGGFMYDDPDDGKSWEVLTEVNKLADPLGIRSELEQDYYLMDKFAATIAKLFKGDTPYTFKYLNVGKTVTLPKISYYEIFNEDNITGTSWAGWDAWGGIEDNTEAATVTEYMADLQALLANAILAHIPDAKISYSSLAAHYGPVFNTDDLTLLATHLMKNSFTLNNFHPYANEDPIHGKEDLIKQRWAATTTVLASQGMTSYDTFFGEYGYTKEIYDPACVLDATKRINVRTDTPNMTWNRGYGEAEYAKLFARHTVTLLSLPAYGINPYGVQTLENESWGYDINDDGTGGMECWQSSALVRFEIFDRVADTGVLANKDDEPTRYELNQAGVAFAIISKYLAKANGLITTHTHELGQGEFLNTELFTLGEGRYAMTASYYRTYDYGANAMDYMSGAKDNGFSDKKQFDFKIDGLTITSATAVSLTDGAKTSLTVSGKVVEDVVVGAMPVILLFNETD